jgi:hypothetical protein
MDLRAAIVAARVSTIRTYAIERETDTKSTKAQQNKQQSSAESYYCSSVYIVYSRLLARHCLLLKGC